MSWSQFSRMFWEIWLNYLVQSHYWAVVRKSFYRWVHLLKLWIVVLKTPCRVHVECWNWWPKKIYPKFPSLRTEGESGLNLSENATREEVPCLVHAPRVFCLQSMLVGMHTSWSRSRNKMVVTLQTIFSNGFSWLKILVFWFKFLQKLFLWV